AAGRMQLRPGRARCRATKAISTKQRSKRRLQTPAVRCADKSQIPNPKSQTKGVAAHLRVLGFGIWVLGFAVSCARPHITLPTDPGIPLPDFRTIQMQLSAACVGVRTLTAEMALSGRAGRQRLRGR